MTENKPLALWQFQEFDILLEIFKSCWRLARWATCESPKFHFKMRSPSPLSIYEVSLWSDKTVLVEGYGIEISRSVLRLWSVSHVYLMELTFTNWPHEIREERFFQIAETIDFLEKPSKKFPFALWYISLIIACHLLDVGKP